MIYLIKFDDHITSDYISKEMFLTDALNPKLIQDYIDLMASWDDGAAMHTSVAITTKEADILTGLADVVCHNEADMRAALEAVGWEITE